MPDKLVGIVEKYFTAVRDVHRLGAGTKERSYYPALAELLNAVGQELILFENFDRDFSMNVINPKEHVSEVTAS